MYDLAKEVLNQLKQEDRPSRFVLVARGRDYQHPSDTFHRPEYRKILKVTAPVEDGSISFKISFLDNHRREDLEWEWEHIEFSGEEWEGAVGFVDGFMSHGINRFDQLSLFRLVEHEAEDNPTSVASWSLINGEDEKSTRMETLRGAMKSLLSK